MNKEELTSLKYEICRKYGEFGLSTSKVPSKVWSSLINNEVGLINKIAELQAKVNELKEANKKWKEEHARIYLTGVEKVKELKAKLQAQPKQIVEEIKKVGKYALLEASGSIKCTGITLTNEDLDNLFKNYGDN